MKVRINLNSDGCKILNKYFTKANAFYAPEPRLPTGLEVGDSLEIEVWVLLGVFGTLVQPSADSGDAQENSMDPSG